MNVYAFIIPIVLILLIAEIIISLATKNGIYSFQDTVTNIGTGIGNQCVNLAVAFFVYQFYGWLYSFIPWKIPETWYTLFILLILQDFVFYWFHRVGHTINIFWAAHMPHHSSEEMNLSVGVRASFTQRLFQFLFFDWVLVLVGFSPEAIYAMAAVHLLIAYWHHTRLINKLGFFEKYFVTPSHHRVHHGVNPQYIDKNFSEFLIVWDKIFGTFEAEKEEVCYGITHPPRTWDPIYINFQYWKQLWDDAAAAPYWVDKFKLWFMPLGWRPRGLPQLDKDKRIGYTKKEQTKFTSQQYKYLKPYLALQISFLMLYMFFAINLKFPLEGWHRLIMSTCIFLSIISWGGLMQAKTWALLLNIISLLLCGITLTYTIDFIGLANWNGLPIILTSCFIGGSILFASYFFNKNAVEGEPFDFAKAYPQIEY